MNGSGYSFAASVDGTIDIPGDKFTQAVKRSMAHFEKKYNQAAQVCLVKDSDLTPAQADELSKAIGVPVKRMKYIPTRNYWLAFDRGRVENEPKVTKEI